MKASISSFDSVRAWALTRGSSRVGRIVGSEQFVSLFLVFLRPRLVFLVACYFDEVVFRGFLSIPRILTELRSEKFEWFDPSPIEPFNSGDHRGVVGHPKTFFPKRRKSGCIKDRSATCVRVCACE